MRFDAYVKVSGKTGYIAGGLLSNQSLSRVVESNYSKTWYALDGKKTLFYKEPGVTNTSTLKPSGGTIKINVSKIVSSYRGTKMSGWYKGSYTFGGKTYSGYFKYSSKTVSKSNPDSYNLGDIPGYVDDIDPCK